MVHGVAHCWLFRQVLQALRQFWQHRFWSSGHSCQEQKGYKKIWRVTIMHYLFTSSRGRGIIPPESRQTSCYEYYRERVFKSHVTAFKQIETIPRKTSSQLPWPVVRQLLVHVCQEQAWRLWLPADNVYTRPALKPPPCWKEHDVLVKFVFCLTFFVSTCYQTDLWKRVKSGGIIMTFLRSPIFLRKAWSIFCSSSSVITASAPPASNRIVIGF